MNKLRQLPHYERGTQMCTMMRGCVFGGVLAIFLKKKFVRCRHQPAAAAAAAVAAACILQRLQRTRSCCFPASKTFGSDCISDENCFPQFPVVMDEEYYSGSGEWEGTDGNTVRMNLLLLSSISFAAANYLSC